MELVQDRSFIPKKGFEAFHEAERCYKQTGTFSNEILETLHSYFDEPFTMATELLEKSQITCFTTSDHCRKFYVVATSKDHFTIFDNINYCHCDFFKSHVLDSQTNISCRHVLAVYLAKIVGKVKSETLSEQILQEYLDMQLHRLLDNTDSQQYFY